MSRSPKSTRFPSILFLAIAIPVALAACGGGSATAPGGQASIGVSVSSAAALPAGTAPAALPADAGTAAVAPSFDNILVAVTRLALIPSSGPGVPDNNGQLEAPNSPSEESPSGEPGLVTVTLPAPVVIDLLHPPAGAQVAKLLNRFDGVPAGSYGKIRLYYDNVVGYAGGVRTLFHPTAHYHFDVHFTGGKLVVPEATNPANGVRFYAVAIRLVGLRYHSTGSGSWLLRPQVFAEVEGVKYLVSGTARNVDPAAATFDVVLPDNQAIRAAWSPSTGWFLADGRIVDVTAGAGSAVLRDRATVDVVGTFGGTGSILAGEVDVTLPDAASGSVDAGWLPDNTFLLRTPTDNLTVRPMPDRAGAYYDNGAFPFAALPDTAVAAGVAAKARGYLAAAGLEAFWISIAP